MAMVEAENDVNNSILAIINKDNKPVDYLQTCTNLLHQTNDLYGEIEKQHKNLKYIKKMLNDVFSYVEYGRLSITIIKNDFKRVKANL